MKTIFLTVVCFFSLAGVGLANSDPGSWYPQFDALQRVQVDPSFKNRDDLRGELRQIVEQFALKHNVAAYAVVTREGERGADAANRLVSRMLHAWRQKREFPAESYVVIVWMAQRNNDNHGSMAVVVGRQVFNLGLNSADLKKVCDESGSPDPAQAIKTALTKLNNNIESRMNDNGLSAGAICLLALLALFVVIGVTAVVATGDAMMFFWFLFVLSNLNSGGSGGATGGSSF